MSTVPMAEGLHATHRTGFSLIEVVLALLIFVMGVLGVLALFPTATSHNRDAQDYTYTAQFARRVFDGVLAQAIGNTNFWDQLSNHVATGCSTPFAVSVEPHADDFFWQTLTPTAFRVLCFTGQQTIVFRSEEDPNVADHMLRYRLTGILQEMPRNLQFDTWYPNATNIQITLPDGTVSNRLVPTNQPVSYWWSHPDLYSSYETRYRDRTLNLVLEVWPGKFGERNKRTYYCYVPRFW